MMKHFSRLDKLDRAKIAQMLWSFYKDSYQMALGSANQPKAVLFILGCQRSGTTLMTDIFQRDLTTKIYQEHSSLSSQDERRLRLNPLPQVKAALARDKAALIVLKPLVETQNADKLLAYFEHSKALWMYRHYKDVAASKLKKSGMQNGIRDMQHIVERSNSWRAENVSEHIRELILEFYHEEMNPYDAAALYWYVRNSFLFELGLYEDPNVMLCKYEDFVQAPNVYVERIYRFVGHPLSSKENLADVYATSIGKGANITISPPVAKVCDQMLARLDALYAQNKAQVAESVR